MQCPGTCKRETLAVLDEEGEVTMRCGYCWVQYVVRRPGGGAHGEKEETE